MKELLKLLLTLLSILINIFNMDDKRVPFNTTISKKLIKESKKLAIDLDIRHNQLLEEALKDILKKYSKLR